MGGDIYIWNVHEGRIREIAVETGGYVEIISVDNLEATLDNVLLFLEQESKLFDSLPLDEDMVTRVDTKTKSEKKESDDFEAWVNGLQRWEPSRETNSSAPEAQEKSSDNTTGESIEIAFPSWEEMSTIEDDVCPACDEDFKNHHGVISHLSSGSCPANTSLVEQHKMLNITKEKALLYVARLTEPVGPLESISVKELVQRTGQGNIKYPLETLADQGLLETAPSPNSDNEVNFRITDEGLEKIRESFQSNPERLAGISPALSSWIFGEGINT